MPKTIVSKSLAGVEVLRAGRSVEADSWFGSLAFKAWGEFGAALDFFSADNLGVTVLGSGEMYKMMANNEDLRSISVPRAVKRAKRTAPDSFRQPLALRPVGVDVFDYNENGVGSRVFVMTVEDTDSQVATERQGVVNGVDLTTGRWHQWGGMTPVVKLAIVRSSEIGIELLNGLVEYFPDCMEASPGRVERVQFVDA